MVDRATAHSASRRARVVIALLLAVILLVVAGLIYASRQTVEAPVQSTTETRPNSAQNIPPSSDGSVTQDGDETDPTTPSSTGTGANNYLSEEQGGVGDQ